MGIPLILSASILIFSGKVILSAAFGERFLAAYNPMIWIICGIVALAYHVVLDNYFAGKGYPAVTVWSSGLALITNIGLNLFLIPKYGISGAAMSTCFAYVLLTTVKLFAFRRSSGVTYQEFFVPKGQDIMGLESVFRSKKVERVGI